jgi:hypothetical protein
MEAPEMTATESVEEKSWFEGGAYPIVDHGQVPTLGQLQRQHDDLLLRRAIDEAVKAETEFCVAEILAAADRNKTLKHDLDEIVTRLRNRALTHKD